MMARSISRRVRVRSVPVPVPVPSAFLSHVHRQGSLGLRGTMSRMRYQTISGGFHAYNLRRSLASVSSPYSGNINEQYSRSYDETAATPSESNNKRKHFWSLEELDTETERLLAYCRGELSMIDATATASPDIAIQHISSSRHIFHVLEAWMEQAKDGQGIQAAKKAQTVLESVLNPPALQTEDADQRYSSLPRFITSNYCDVVLQAFAVCDGGLQAAEQAEALLRNTMIHHHPHCHSNNNDNEQQQRRRLMAPTLKSFNIVLMCWARSHAREAGVRATQLIENIMMDEWNRQMVPAVFAEDADRDGRQCWVDERSLVNWIDAWTHSGHAEAPERALSILREALYATDHDDSDNINSSSSSSSDISSDTTAADNNNMFRNLQLDVAVFNATIHAWVRSNRGRPAALQAEEILHLLIQWSQTRQLSLSSSPLRMGDDEAAAANSLKPNTRTYSLIIDAWAHCEQDEENGNAAERAEAILFHMYQQYREGRGDGGIHVKPNAIVFTTCVAAWSRAAPHCNPAPERAERLWDKLNEMYLESGSRDPDLEPGPQIANAVISAWSRCRNRDDSVEGALRALERFKQMAMVDLTSYNTVLDGMSKKGMGRDAMKMLQWLEAECQKSGQEHLTPDTISYNSVLAALSRSTTDRSKIGDEAERLLRSMEALDGSANLQGGVALPERPGRHLKPDKRSYTGKFLFSGWFVFLLFVFL